MRSSITVSIDERTIKVMSALMEQRHMSRSEAINYLAWQGVLRLQEINSEEAKE
jgi:hypothetical protein